MRQEQTFTIHIVDDETTMSESLKRSIERMIEETFTRKDFCIVFTFGRPTLLLRKLKEVEKGANTCFIIDFLMPEMQGTEVIRKLKEDEEYKNEFFALFTGNKSNLSDAEISMLNEFNVGVFQKTERKALITALLSHIEENCDRNLTEEHQC